MKTSNAVLIVLALFLLALLLAIDQVLARQYRRINLSDPYKNFELLPVSPFHALQLTGGNGYAIRVVQGSRYEIRLLRSRKSFFTMRRGQDSLFIHFAVANQNYQQPQASTVGLIITVPDLRFLKLSGTNNEVGPFTGDTLKIIQDRNTITRLKGLTLSQLQLEASGYSSVDFIEKNKIGWLRIQNRNRSLLFFNDIRFNRVQTQLADSAALVFKKTSLENLLHAAATRADSPRGK